LLYGFFFAQVDLGLFTKLSATGKLPTGFFEIHLSKVPELPNNEVPNFYLICEDLDIIKNEKKNGVNKSTAPMKNTTNTWKGEGLDRGTLTLDGRREIPAASQQGFVGEASSGGE
jgi:hypothetical protein